MPEARIYTLPEQPVPIHLSGFGPQGAELAGRIGDGFCTVFPDGELIRVFRETGGADKPIQAGMTVCWGADAGVDEVYVPQVGPDHDGFFSGRATQVLPELRGSARSGRDGTDRRVAVLNQVIAPAPQGVPGDQRHRRPT